MRPIMPANNMRTALGRYTRPMENPVNRLRVSSTPEDPSSAYTRAPAPE
jgi:hypothetical protein